MAGGVHRAPPELPAKSKKNVRILYWLDTFIVRVIISEQGMATTAHCDAVFSSDLVDKERNSIDPY